MSTISKTDLENALDKIERALEKHEISVSQEFDDFREALNEAESAYRQGTAGKEYEDARKKVEDLRKCITNWINDEEKDWSQDVKDEIGGYDEEPRFTIDPLNSMEFDIDSDEID